MRSNLVSLLQRFHGWRLSLAISVLAVIAVELIVSAMAFILKGEVTADYLLTGLVAAGFVAPASLLLMGGLLGELARQRQEVLAQGVHSAEARLRVALDSSDEGILMVGHDGRVLSANRRFLELWRVPATLAAAGDDSLLLAHVIDQLSDPDGFMEGVRRLYDSDAEASDTLRFKDGRVFSRYTRALSLGSEQGRIWCFRDVSEQVQAQATLAEREAIYRAIVNQAGDGIDLVDADTLRFVEVNDAACRMLGYQRKELLRQPLAMVQADRDDAALGDAVAALRRAGHGSIESRYRGKDGRILDVQINARLVRLNERDFLVSVWRDVTESKRAEAGLREREEIFSAIVNRSVEGILLIDAETMEFTEFNDAACEGLGYARDEFSRLRLPDVQGVMSAAETIEKCRVAAITPNGLSFEDRHRCKDGSLRDRHVSNRPVRVRGRTYLAHVWHDVTEHKRMERHLRLAIEAAQAILWEFDLRSGRLSFDPVMLRVLNMAADDAPDTIAKWIERIHPDDRGPFQERIALATQPGDPVFSFEYRMRDRTGAYQWIHSRGRVIERSEGGQALLAVGTTMNITERRQVSEGLRASERRSSELASLLRLMCDNVPDMIWAKDLEKRYLFANKAMCEQLLHAADTDEPLGRDDMFFALRERQAHADDPQWHTFGELCQDSDAVTLANGRPSVFEESGNIGGRMVWLEVHKAPFRDAGGKVIGTVGSARNVTERRQLDAELEGHRKHLEDLVQQRTGELLATEVRASRILESAADGLYGVDTDGRITFINPAACKLLGYSADEVLGRSAHDLFHHSKPDGSPYPADECRGRHAWREGRDARFDDVTYWHSSGRPVPLALAVHPMFEDGQVVGAVISIVDIKEQRAAAQAREQALIAAEGLARARSEFLANMSHEIRTPMNGMLGFAHIGLRNFGDPEKSLLAFEKILDSGQHLLAVVDDVLDFSKIDAGQLRIEATEMSLDQALDRAIALVADRARAKGLELRLEKAPDLPSVCVADPLRIGQILLNLLTNAVKFTDAGGIVLAASRSGGQLVMRVTDTGIGMTEDQLDYIFNPFQQADGSTTRKFGGTGLGLAICKRLLELMQGDIRVESRLGAGSSFEVRLPDVRPAAPRREAEAREPEPALGDRPLEGLSILLAEDEPTNRLMLEFNLLDYGARLVMVGDGLEAVEHVTQGGPRACDVVLMDIQMPKMDGYAAARRILEMAPELPIIGQTAHAFDEERDKCFAAGMVAHIAKPIDPRALARLILRVVADKRRP